MLSSVTTPKLTLSSHHPRAALTTRKPSLIPISIPITFGADGSLRPVPFFTDFVDATPFPAPVPAPAPAPLEVAVPTPLSGEANDDSAEMAAAAAAAAPLDPVEPDAFAGACWGGRALEADRELVALPVLVMLACEPAGGVLMGEGGCVCV